CGYVAAVRICATSESGYNAIGATSWLSCSAPNCAYAPGGGGGSWPNRAGCPYGISRSETATAMNPRTFSLRKLRVLYLCWFIFMALPFRYKAYQNAATEHCNAKAKSIENFFIF